MATEVMEKVVNQPSAVANANPIESYPQMFERLAKDRLVNVDKLERLMQMHERAMARFSKERFNSAMAEAQKAMRPVKTDSKNKQTNSRYASYEALDEAIRPVYTHHGFGLSFDTGETPLEEHVRVLCDVSHVGGHSKTYHVDIPADGKGAKGGDVMTKTHAVGSALSYGMRYLLKLIFNIAITDADDDGNAASAGESTRDAPKPAERKSQQKPQASETQPVKESKPVDEAATTQPSQAKNNVGRIVDHQKSIDGKGEAMIVVLDTGYRAGTRNVEIMKSIEAFRKMDATVEINAKARATGYLPSIENVVPVRRERAKG